MTRKLIGLLLTLLGIVVGALAVAQTPSSSAASQPAQAGSPTFEVASVKRNMSGEPRVTVMNQGGRYTATNIQLRFLIRVAYGVQDFQITGGPDWLDSDRFDVVAKLPDNPAPGQLPVMLQSLLAERFKLAVHKETRELPVYALVTARSDGKLGSGLRPSTVDCAAQIAAGRGRGGPPPEPPQPGQPPQRPTCGAIAGRGRLMGGGMTMGQLATNLSGRVNRVVLDRTGLSGSFDVDLEWAPDQFQGAGPFGPLPGQGPTGAPPVSSPDAPSIYTALQEQLGLKLDSQRGPVEALVIDHVEQPTPD